MAGHRQENLQRLLDTMLGSFLDLVRCDAGSVFTVRKEPSGDQVLKFESMITRSLSVHGVPDHLRSLHLRIDESTMAGRTAMHRRAFVINSKGESEGSWGGRKVLNYTAKNIFSGPLITPRGDLVGVVQLLNKLPVNATEFDPASETDSPPFDGRDQQLFSMIVGQSALAVENSLLLDEQEHLFDGFVAACVLAIEARDPVTSGHSTRVANLTVGLAEAANRTGAGPLSAVFFTPTQMRELRFAAMLHDIGKIGVNESVLQKEKKLFPHELDIIGMRLRLMRAEMALRQATDKTNYSSEIELLNRGFGS